MRIFGLLCSVCMSGVVINTTSKYVEDLRIKRDIKRIKKKEDISNRGEYPSDDRLDSELRNLDRILGVVKSGA